MLIMLNEAIDDLAIVPCLGIQPYALHSYFWLLVLVRCLPKLTPTSIQICSESIRSLFKGSSVLSSLTRISSIVLQCSPITLTNPVPSIPRNNSKDRYTQTNVTRKAPMVDNPGSGFSYRSPGVIMQRTRHISFFLAHF